MIECESIRYETWNPPPQEGQPGPRWTRLFVNDREISNSIEAAEWTKDPAELIACELCWDATCAHSGLAHIVGLSSQVLLLRPRLEQIDDFWREHTDSSNLIEVPILIDRQIWDELSSSFHSVPTFDWLPRPSFKDILTLWLEELPADNRSAQPHDQISLEMLPDILRQHCIAADPLSLDDSIALVERFIEEADSDPPDLYVDGDLLPIDDLTIQLNSFYFDAPGFPEWRSFAVADHSLVIANRWLFSVSDVET